MRSAARCIPLVELDPEDLSAGGKATVIDLRVPDRYVLREPGRADRFASKDGSSE